MSDPVKDIPVNPVPLPSVPPNYYNWISYGMYIVMILLQTFENSGIISSGSRPYLYISWFVTFLISIQFGNHASAIKSAQEQGKALYKLGK